MYEKHVLSRLINPDSIERGVFRRPNMLKKLYEPKEKIEELESIRGLAALLVVFFHIPIENSYLDIGIIKNGYLMVDLFFVLSGFVIYNSYFYVGLTPNSICTNR
jgi:peptidoglycan/LPS O-acetylase OafA/YrhL